MAAIVKELKGGVQYRDRRFDGDDDAYAHALATSATVYVGNLAFNTREEQVYEVFSMVGPIEKVIMGLNQVTRQPCGFAFVIYFSHKTAQSAASYITGTKLDGRYIRVDIDWGFQAGREFGRGKSGGQVRDEFREDFDAGRGGNPMNAVYSEGMDGPAAHGPPPQRVGDKRRRYTDGGEPWPPPQRRRGGGGGGSWPGPGDGPGRGRRQRPSDYGPPGPYGPPHHGGGGPPLPGRGGPRHSGGPPPPPRPPPRPPRDAGGARDGGDRHGAEGASKSAGVRGGAAPAPPPPPPEDGGNADAVMVKEED